MSGKLLLEPDAQWGRSVPAAIISVLASFLLVVVSYSALETQVDLDGIAFQVAAVVTAYILFRFIYPVVAGWMGRGEEQTIPWTLTEESLTIGPRSIPRQSIRKVHCWPGRNALGQSTGNMVVNIETTGKNRVLRTLSGARAEDHDRKRGVDEGGLAGGIHAAGQIVDILQNALAAGLIGPGKVDIQPHGHGNLHQTHSQAHCGGDHGKGGHHQKIELQIGLQQAG